MLTLSTFHATVTLITANVAQHDPGLRDITGPSRLFGLQDAYLIADNGDNDFYLFDDGCRLGWNGTGSTDCTATCADPEKIWADKYGMHTAANCLTYPKIAQAMTYNRLDDKSLDLARRFNIKPAPENVYNATSVLWPINACILEYCTENNPCPFYQDSTLATMASISHWLGQGCDHLDTTPGARPQSSICTVNVTELCNTAPDVGAVNNDLGGPGVFVSYVIQYTVCVLAWVALNVLDLWVQIFIFFICPGPIYWYLKHPRGLAGGWKVATNVQRKFRESLGSQHDAWLAALVEFQKTQAFFCIAIAVAVYVQISGNLNTVDAKTLQQLQNNTELSNAILYGGLYPLSFMLMLLRRHRLATPFLVLLAVITMVASAVGLRLTSQTNLDKIPVHWVAPNLENCAHTNPIKYCHIFNENDYWWNEILDPKAAYVFLVFQTFDALKIFPAGTYIDEDTKRMHYRRLNIYSYTRIYIERLGCWARLEGYLTTHTRFVRRVGLASRTKLLDFLFWAVRHMIEMATVYFLVITLLVLLSLESPGDGDTVLQFTSFNLGNWTFGQITALLFWLPPVVEYFRIALSSVVASLNSRLPQGYEVVKRDLPQEPEFDPPTRAATQANMFDGDGDAALPTVESMTLPPLAKVSLNLSPPPSDTPRRHSAA